MDKWQEDLMESQAKANMAEKREAMKERTIGEIVRDEQEREIRADERAKVLSELRPLIEAALDGTQSDLGLSARRKLRKAVGL